MVFTDTGKDKIRQICNQLRKETLDPASEEAAQIVKEAEERAAQIIAKAKADAEAVLQTARDEIVKEQEVLDSSLKLACKKSLSYLKQEIAERVFNKELESEVQKHLTKDEIVAKAIDVIFEAISKEGLEGSALASLPKAISAEAVLAHLAAKAKEALSKESIQVGDFEGGAKVMLVDNHMTVDLSDEAIQSLMQKFLAGSLHKFFFEG